MNYSFKNLSKKIENKSARIAIIGMGYVGFPLTLATLRAGYSVVGFDTNQKKIEKLKNGEVYLKHFDKSLFIEISENKSFYPTSRLNELTDVDIILICVPTPLGKHNEPDLSYILDSVESLKSCLKKEQLIILESTTYPGTTRNEMGSIIKDNICEKNITIGQDLFIAYSPEREDPGNAKHTTTSIPKLVGGIDKNSGDLAEAFYRNVVQKVFRVSSSEVAESAKLLENIYRAVNIALVNETKMILDKLNIDIWEVIEAASTKPFGFEKFTPGPGLGGHCIPIDPFYLAWKARSAGKITRFIELAGEINRAMPKYVVETLSNSLNQLNKPISNSKILIVGVAYKPNIDDSRESAAIEIIKQLKSHNANINYHDPYISQFNNIQDHQDINKLNLSSVELTKETIVKYDATMIVTDHDSINWPLIAEYSNLIIDTRNAIENKAGPEGIKAFRENRVVKS